MSMIRVYASICPWCGHDVATVRQVVCMFEVYCTTESHGCGALGPLVSNEALAVAGWNARVDARVQRMSARMRAPEVTAELRRAGFRK